MSSMLTSKLWTRTRKPDPAGDPINNLSLMSFAVHHPALLFGQTRLRFVRSTSGGALASCATAFAMACLLAACGKSASPTPTVEKKPAPKASARPAPSGELDRLMAPPEPAKSAEEVAWEKQADDVMAAHPNMTAQELLNVPKVNAGLRDFLKALSQSQELQKRVNNSIAFAATMKNLQGPKENWQFSMDLSGYEKPRTHRLLTSILSGKPDRVVDFFEHEVTQATSEFTFDPDAKRSTNGISLEPKPALAPKE
jgi:hypothetical protein